MRKFLEAFVIVLGAGDPVFVRKERMDAVLAEILGLLASLPWPLRNSLRLGLYFFEFVSPLFAGKFGRFSRLPVEDRQRVFLRFQNHRWYLMRMLFFSIRNICVLPLFSGGDFHSAIGYRGERNGSC